MRRISIGVAMVVLISIGSAACKTADVKTRAPFVRLEGETELQAAAREVNCVDDGFVRKMTPLKPQENSYWCWAATDQMVEFFFKRTPRQCEIANDFCARKPVPCTGPGCCRLPADCCVTPEACHVPGWPPFSSRKIGFARVPGPLLAREIVDEIACKKRPFLFAWEYVKGGGHIMAAVGFVTSNGVDYLLVNQPLPVNTGDRAHLLYSEFKTGPFRHWDDFYLLEKKP